MEIEEGSKYFFYVEKIINLAGTEYFVLLAEYDKKYLMPTINYIEYQIKIGEKIKCTIDRINCNGKVFLEPECPLYKIGDKDIFTIKEREERTTHKTFDKYYINRALNNITTNAIIVSKENYDTYSQGEKWLCEIIKIKKGELYLKPLLKV